MLLIEQIFHILMIILAFILTVLAIIIFIRSRWIFKWRTRLYTDLNNLKIEINSNQCTETKKQAITIILDHFNFLSKTISPDISYLLTVSDYIGDIARCYHPEEDYPELCLSIGQLIHATESITLHLELIIAQPGFNKIRRVRIRHIRNYIRWYRKISQMLMFKVFKRYQSYFTTLSYLRLIAFPDPFSWLLVLSRRFFILSLIRYLLIDIYLFIGQLAIRMYDNQTSHEWIKPQDLEEIFETLQTYPENIPFTTNLRLMTIRKNYLSFSSIIFTQKPLNKWKKAIISATWSISQFYFPDASHPIEEAAIGPLMNHSIYWIRTISDLKQFSIINRIYHIPVISLYQIKRLADNLPPYLMANISTLLKTYKWIKYPFKMYRWIKKTSPAGIAMEAGLFISKKSLILFVCQYSFDSACKEIDAVYFKSSQHLE